MENRLVVIRERMFQRNWKLMGLMALWVLEEELELKRLVESWNAIVDDEVKMQVKCLSADERQSTIRQSGVTLGGQGECERGLMTHLGGRMGCRSLAPGRNVLFILLIQLHGRRD